MHAYTNSAFSHPSCTWLGCVIRGDAWKAAISIQQNLYNDFSLASATPSTARGWRQKRRPSSSRAIRTCHRAAWRRSRICTDPLAMPRALSEAHAQLGSLVEKCYRSRVFPFPDPSTSKSALRLRKTHRPALAHHPRRRGEKCHKSTTAPHPPAHPPLPGRYPAPSA